MVSETKEIAYYLESAEGAVKVHFGKIFEASHAEQTHHCHKNITTLQLLSVPIASPHR
jgi:hypothetical protein